MPTNQEEQFNSYLSDSDTAYRTWSDSLLRLYERYESDLQELFLGRQHSLMQVYSDYDGRIAGLRDKYKVLTDAANNEYAGRLDGIRQRNQREVNYNDNAIPDSSRTAANTGQGTER